MISTILFDNDGVLVDTEGVFYESNCRMLREFGVELGEAEFSKMSLSQGMSLADIIVSLGYTAETAETARQKRNGLYDIMLRERGASLVIPHVPEILRELHRSYRIGVVTCCQEMHFRTIHTASGLRPLFDFVIGDRDFVHHKPHPDPYQAAAPGGNRSGGGDCRGRFGARACSRQNGRGSARRRSRAESADGAIFPRRTGFSPISGNCGPSCNR